MVYSSFYFLELNKYNITRNIDLKYFLSRVEARMLWFVLPRVKKEKKNHGRSVIHWAFSFQKLAPAPTVEAVDVMYSYIYSSYFKLGLNVIIDFVRNFSVFGVIEYFGIICRG